MIETIRRVLADLPRPISYSIVGAATFAVLGGLAGLVIGLKAYAPTAWFAILEIGVPAALIGSVVGLAVASAASLASRSRRALSRRR